MGISILEPQQLQDRLPLIVVEMQSVTVELLQITGATTFNSGTGNITLNDTSSTLGDLTITGGEVYLQDTGAITATINQASKVQLKAGSGISATSTGVTEFAAESDSGDISITNTGGYAISDFASTSGITGVRFTDSDATGTITLIANSPLTINAPVDAGKGALQLTAAGSESTDDVTLMRLYLVVQLQLMQAIQLQLIQEELLQLRFP